MPDFSALTPYQNSHYPHSQFTGFQQLGTTHTENIGLVFQGWVMIPEAGEWTFGSESDDGSMLYLDGELLVDNDGVHPSWNQKGTVTITAPGLHEYRLEYFSNDGSQIRLRYEGPNFEEYFIPDDRLFRYQCNAQIPEPPVVEEPEPTPEPVQPEPEQPEPEQPSPPGDVV
jgi:hypothetical protein